MIQLRSLHSSLHKHPRQHLRQILYLLLATALAACTAPTPAHRAAPQPAASRIATDNTAPIIDYRERFLPVVAQNGMVVGPEAPSALWAPLAQWIEARGMATTQASKRSPRRALRAAAPLG